MENGPRRTPKACGLCGEDQELDYLYRKNVYPILRCRSCTLVYVDAALTEEDLDRIYGASFFNIGSKFAGEVSSPGAANAALRVERLLQLPEVGLDCWLDVGCANGDFLLAAGGQVKRTCGVEISSYASEAARQRGIEAIWRGDFLEAQLPRTGFDLISMWDYIEHVQEPLANLRKAYELLRPGGYLALSTGDIGSPIARLMGRIWHLMIPPKHLYFFSRSTLRSMLTTAGYYNITIRYYGKRVPADFMLWKLASLAHPGLGERALHLANYFKLERLAPQVNLWDIMTVIARKPISAGNTVTNVTV
jgi:SAM-dependent methyltransferase